jgi:hypothetical protein
MPGLQGVAAVNGLRQPEELSRLIKDRHVRRGIANELDGGR